MAAAEHPAAACEFTLSKRRAAHPYLGRSRRFRHLARRRSRRHAGYQPESQGWLPVSNLLSAPKRAAAYSFFAGSYKFPGRFGQRARHGRIFELACERLCAKACTIFAALLIKILPESDFHFTAQAGLRIIMHRVFYYCVPIHSNGPAPDSSAYGASVVSVGKSWPGGCKRGLFFFRSSPNKEGA